MCIPSKTAPINFNVYTDELQCSIIAYLSPNNIMIHRQLTLKYLLRLLTRSVNISTVFTIIMARVVSLGVINYSVIFIYYIKCTQSLHNKQLISKNKGSLNKAKHQSNDSSSRGTNIILHITVKNFINKVYAQFIKFTLRIIT